MHTFLLYCEPKEWNFLLQQKDDRDEWEKWRKVSNAVGIILYLYSRHSPYIPPISFFYYHERNAPPTCNERMTETNGDASLNQMEVSMLSSECTTRSRSLWCCIVVPWLLLLYGLCESNLIEFFDIAVTFCKLQPTNFISISQLFQKRFRGFSPIYFKCCNE